jgi:trans-aconitate 2-methyltransferase
VAEWDPSTYERYKAQRDRPALDLLLQIPRDLQPAEIWDLGCGTGEQAAVLAARHPNARVHGLDSSESMLAVARNRKAPVDWRMGDIAAFAPPVAPDLIFTNAALQWLPDHQALFPRLAAVLAPGGVLACQMPIAREGRWRALLGETAADPRWSARLAGVDRISMLSDGTYYDLLSPTCEVDIWSTRYLHVLEGEDAVLECTRGTSLRPYLERLDDQAGAFETAFAAQLRAAYPRREDGTTLMEFSRLFIVARRFDA